MPKYSRHDPRNKKANRDKMRTKLGFQHSKIKKIKSHLSTDFVEEAPKQIFAN